jgi:hypothetical protein
MWGSSTSGAVTDLVEKRYLGAQNRPRGRGTANSAGAVGDGEPDELVEL